MVLLLQNYTEEKRMDLPSAGAFWLIETVNNVPEYWAGKSETSFNPDIHKAVKFYDEPSADKVINNLLSEYSEVLASVEHAFSNPT